MFRHKKPLRPKHVVKINEINVFVLTWYIVSAIDKKYNRDLTLYSPVVSICTASLTFNNSTFCPHGVFMCFVWI